MGYVGWLLPEETRAKLLAVFKPDYPDVIAHHVTLKFGVTEDYPLPDETNGVVVGLADDGEGIQALVVAIGGTTDRGDGSTYHVTWSLDRSNGYKPVQSNDLIKLYGWQPVEHIRVELVPQYFAK